MPIIRRIDCTTESEPFRARREVLAEKREKQKSLVTSAPPGKEKNQHRHHHQRDTTDHLPRRGYKGRRIGRLHCPNSHFFVLKKRLGLERLAKNTFYPNLLITFELDVPWPFSVVCIGTRCQFQPTFSPVANFRSTFRAALFSSAIGLLQ